MKNQGEQNNNPAVKARKALQNRIIYLTQC